MKNSYNYSVQYHGKLPLEPCACCSSFREDASVVRGFRRKKVILTGSAFSVRVTLHTVLSSPIPLQLVI
ncbi:hypothetical protein D3C73_1548830 [compost metagenome]